tara:strand:- start:291 stop:998 length:708 start_codon:yes stop_codon:yes gene_type:complete
MNNFLKIFKQKKNDVIEEMTSEENKLIDKCIKYSMTTRLRMWSLINSINYVSNKNIKGDFVECGIWKGGNIMIFNILNKKKKLNKKIYGYDTFEGMPLPSQFDYKYDGRSALDLFKKRTNSKDGWAKSTFDEVKNNLLRECSMDNTHLVKGLVENTLLVKKNLPKKISILRLDTDFYESTKIELEILFPLLEKNGVLIIDDYGHYKGARKAVDEYFKKKPFLIYVDHSCRVFINN